jgi:hypothetical protein
MHKIIAALLISAALILSGTSATTFSTGQLISTVSADAGGE